MITNKNQLTNQLSQLIKVSKLHQQYETIGSQVGHQVIMPDGETVGEKILHYGNEITRIREIILESSDKIKGSSLT